MAWPISTATKTHLDASTDDPSQARIELASLVDKVNEIIGQMAQIAAANKIVVYDASGKLNGDITGDAATVDGKHASATPGDSVIPVGDPNGRIAWGAKPAFRGARVYASGNTTLTTDIKGAAAFAAEEYDTDSIHSTSANDSRLTVPSGVTKVRITGCLTYAQNATGIRSTYIRKNNSDFVRVQTSASSAGHTSHCIDSGVVAVTAGDYFELAGVQSSGGDLAIFFGSFNTWFAMEIIE